jgi:hypothetical protein
MDRQTLRDWVHRFNAAGEGSKCAKIDPSATQSLPPFHDDLSPSLLQNTASGRSLERPS